MSEQENVNWNATMFGQTPPNGTAVNGQTPFQPSKPKSAIIRDWVNANGGIGSTGMTAKRVFDGLGTVATANEISKTRINTELTHLRRKAGIKRSYGPAAHLRDMLGQTKPETTAPPPELPKLPPAPPQANGDRQCQTDTGNGLFRAQAIKTVKLVKETVQHVGGFDNLRCWLDVLEHR